MQGTGPSGKYELALMINLTNGFWCRLARNRQHWFLIAAAVDPLGSPDKRESFDARTRAYPSESFCHQSTWPTIEVGQ
jgi:hypothetical protein